MDTIIGLIPEVKASIQWEDMQFDLFMRDRYFPYLSSLAKHDSFVTYYCVSTYRQTTEITEEMNVPVKGGFGYTLEKFYGNLSGVDTRKIVPIFVLALKYSLRSNDKSQVLTKVNSGIDSTQIEIIENPLFSRVTVPEHSDKDKKLSGAERRSRKLAENFFVGLSSNKPKKAKEADVPPYGYFYLETACNIIRSWGSLDWDLTRERSDECSIIRPDLKVYHMDLPSIITKLDYLLTTGIKSVGFYLDNKHDIEGDIECQNINDIMISGTKSYLQNDQEGIISNLLKEVKLLYWRKNKDDSYSAFVTLLRKFNNKRYQ